ncbi:BrnT family toxin [Tardiphaga alba]|uniref:BrnT family toxin n=1 Tax=Tardiphaga alba TaxID=340268 RepID=A0ABX8A8J6_9BRAD|nr:BrnT family toxin [Tardiphaga alba]QUS40066.1 BrnT family toxin [Tardiphaga alba]
MATTFDPVKRKWTIEHRGLDFAVDADEVFGSIKATKVDDRFDYGEVRYISAGYVRSRMAVMVWTVRGDDRHVISMRYCHAKEETYWQAYFRQSGD